MSSAESPLAILDLGTSRVSLLQARLVDGLLQYLGHVSLPAQGMRKGSIVALQPAALRIREAALELERRTGAPLERVFLSLTGAHVKGMSSQAGIPLTSRSREVTREDARRVLDLARTLTLPDDRQILHVVPQEFVLDRQGGILEPVGMLASRIEARVYAVTVATGIKDNLVLAANQAGLEVQELIFAPLAVAEASLRAEDRHSGVAVVDLGAGSTGIAVYTQGSLAHACAVPIGGDHFTNDIAVGLGTPLAEAEKIKHAFGAARTDMAAENSVIEVPAPPAGNPAGNTAQPPRLLPQRRLGDCIEPRARELVRLIQAEVGRMGGLGAGVVLSGGGGRLAGLPEMLQATLDLPVRFAQPALLEGMPEQLGEPEFAFLVGACYSAHRLLSRQAKPPSLWEKLRQKWEELA